MWINDRRGMGLSVRAKTRGGFGLALLFLFVLGAISYRSTASFVEINERLAHCYHVLATLETLDSLLEDTEIGSHGYAMTGHEQYLEPIAAAAARIDQTVGDLRRLTASNAAQQRRLDALEPLIAEELDLLRAEVDSRREEGLESAMKLVLTSRQMEIRHDFHQLLGEMQDEERGRIAQAHEQVRWGAGYTIALVIFGSLAAITLVGLAVFFIDRDIVRRWRAEQALRASEDRFRRLAENAPDVIYRYEVSPNKGFSYVSPAATRMFGYTPEEFCAEPDPGLSMMRPDDRRLFQALLEGRRVAEPLVVGWLHKDGRTVWTELRNAPILDDSGNLLAIEGIARDITEQRQMQEQLLRTQRLETAGRIAGQVAHDFNNLLSPLTAYPDLIKTRLPEGHPAASLCDAMREAAQRMAQINEDLLTLGRRGRITEETVDVNHVVEQAIADMPQQPDTLALDLDLAGDLLPVKGSSAQLLRVATNLIANARDAMGEVGRLAITTENVYMDEPYVRLRVSDTGSGIPAEIRDKIFDPFFTTKRAGKRNGSGLGLSVVQAIVEDHQGYVDLQSEMGKGTTFSVYLPACGVAPAEQRRQELRGGSETILVVDDDRLHREVVRKLLETVGYRVEVAASGEEALARLADHPVDLLILDMIMPPGIDGAETYRRALEVRPGQRAVIVSGFGESGTVREAQALGAGSHLRKPVTLDKLARAVREELDRTRSEQAFAVAPIGEPLESG